MSKLKRIGSTLFGIAITGLGLIHSFHPHFTNVAEVLKQANSPIPKAIRACYDDLHFTLTNGSFSSNIYNSRKLDWLHGENDKNVALKSVQLFLSKFKKAGLTIIAGASHAIDARVLVR